MICCWCCLHCDAWASPQFALFLWGSKMERGHRWIPRIPLCDGASRELYQPGNAVARWSGTTRKACYMQNFMGRFSYTQSCLSLAEASQSLMCLWLSMSCHDLWNQSRRIPHSWNRHYAFMITSFMEEVSCAQLEYARCAGKGRSCIKTWRNLVQRVVLEDWRTS